MIVYLDTSAFVPLLVGEPGTAQCRDLWEAADSVVCTRLLYVEASAALARANRAGRLSARAHAVALDLRDDLWASVAIVHVDESLMVRATVISKVYRLCGYDAVHCAAAELVNEPQLVAASGDADLLSAWRALGLATYSTAAA